MRLKLLLTGWFTCILMIPFCQTEVRQTDVLVIGGGTGGVAAGLQSARRGARTTIVEPTNMLGGMLTAAGVSCTDGNDDLPSGLWQEFRQALYRHYGTTNLGTGWVSNTCFEPHVGDSIFKAFAAREKKLQVLYGWTFEKVLKQANRVMGAQFKNTRQQTLLIHASITIDATELGDVLAGAGVSFRIGMDDAPETGEPEACVKNNIIQDLTWAAILKDYGAGADKTISKPAGYDPKKYECSTADAPCLAKPYAFDTKKVLDYGKLPNNKYMLNWPVHGNDYYLNVVSDDTKTRTKKYKAAKNQTLGFIYFLQTTLGQKNIGLADDELDKGLALIPYNREGRRMKGVVQLNLNHLKNPYYYALYRTGISVGNYPVDHHHAQYNGKIPAIQFPSIPAFNVPLGALIPQKVDGLIVCEKAISVTNLVNGTTRLQPVVLLTGQAAGALAAESIKQKKQPRHISVRDVQQQLLRAKCYLMPFMDVSPADPHWEAVQRIGVTGLLKGVGKSEPWNNKLLFYPDTLVTEKELQAGMVSFYRIKKTVVATNTPITIQHILSLITTWLPFLQARQPHFDIGDLKARWTTWQLKNFDAARPVTKYELAVLFDNLLYPFNEPVTWQGLRRP